MFRRQTDQVYEMLQQVQRRMSQGDSASSLSNHESQARTPSVPSHESTAPFWRRSVQGTEDGAAPVTPPQPPPSPAPRRTSSEPFAPVMGPHPGEVPPVQVSAGGTRLQLSLPLASILMLLWILTLLIAYYIGRQHQQEGGSWPSIGFASGEAGHREPSPVTEPAPGAEVPAAVTPVVANTGPADVLVLKSVRNFDKSIQSRWLQEAEQLNDTARTYSRDLPPLFGVREPTTGGLQLIYGFKDGRFGVDRDHYANQTKLIKAIPEYKDALWRSLR